MAKGQQIITELLFNINANSAQLKTELTKTNNSINKFSNDVKGIAGAVGIAFGVGQVLNFGLEVSKLAGEFKGVETAFKKLEGSQQLLLDLKRATAGTVSELDLMKRAVQFSNFGLELQQLPKLLEFASKRAAATGQSIDYLVDSIVTGLGRKSVLILDNLGISSQQLNAEIAKTGDFFSSVGTIVDKELTKMGDLVETTMTKTERLNAAWTNFKITLGQAGNEAGILGASMDAMSASLTVAGSKNLSFWEKLAAVIGGGVGIANAVVEEYAAEVIKASDELKKHEKIVKDVSYYYRYFNKDIEAYTKFVENSANKTALLTEFQKLLNAEDQQKAANIENIANLTKRLTDLQQLQLTQVGAQLLSTNQEIKSIDAKIKALKELGTVQEKVYSKRPQSAIDYEKEMADNRKHLKQPDKTASTALMGDPNSTELAEKNFANLNMLIEQHNGNVLQAKDNYSLLGTEMSTTLPEIGELFSSTLVAGIDAASSALVGLGESGKKTFASMVQSLLQGLKKIVNGLLAQAIAGLIAGEATKGVVGLGIAAAGIGVLTAMFDKLVMSKFAVGTNNAPGGLAVVGERGREIVNLPAGSRVNNNFQTERMLNKSNGGASRLITKVSGEDLYFILEETKRRRNYSI